MKKSFLLLLVFLFTGVLANSQSVGINSTGDPPNSSAMLDVSSTTKGFLPPRMTTLQRNEIPSPAVGLMIYNTDEKIINVFNGTSWALLNPVVCGQTFSDPRDGKIYSTEQIGSQCWMAQNLNVGTSINGSVDQTNNSPTPIIEKYCYDNIEANCDVYGGLYQWDEMMQYSTTPGIQGICPPYWHLPTDAEWCTLTTFIDATVNCSIAGDLGTDAGGNMKEAGTTHWISPNTGATNSSGFTALPGGFCPSGNFFTFLGNESNFWTSTEYSATNAWYRRLKYTQATINRNISSSDYGFSVRCIMD